MLHNGTEIKKRNIESSKAGYTFATTLKKDSRSINQEKNKQIKEYRDAIQGTLKVLEGA